MRYRNASASILLHLILMVAALHASANDVTDNDTLSEAIGQPVRLRFSNVQPEKGKIWISVCTEAELPERDDGACTESIQIDALEGAEHTFDRLPPGTYAITAFHDENDNGWMDWDTRGLPFEATVNARNA